MVEQKSELTQVRIRRDVNGERTSYEEFDVGKDLGKAVLFVTQEEIDAFCGLRDFYHPWYSIDSPFGGTIVPVGMTYEIARDLFCMNYSVSGLIYKWSFDLHKPLHSNAKYQFNGHMAEKWVHNDREFIAYEGTCLDERDETVFTTRRVHVLDFIKRTAPRIGEDGLDSYDAQAVDSPKRMKLEAMAAAAAAQRSQSKAEGGNANFVPEVLPLATQDTTLGAVMPCFSMSYSQARFDRDFPTHVGHGGAATRSRHIDPDAIRQEGMAAPFAGARGVMTLIYNSAMQFFGEGWVVGGKSDLTMRRPVVLDDFITAKGFVKGLELLPSGLVRLVCEVWIENQIGEKPVVGTVSGIVSS